MRARHMKHHKGGGRTSDEKQDKAMIKAAVHKHEKHDHPGEAMTPLKRGGKVHGKKGHKRLDRSHKAHGGKVMFGHEMKREHQSKKDRMHESKGAKRHPR